MSTPLAQAFYARLISSQTAGTLYALCAGRVYLDSSPADSALPVAIIEAETTTSERFMAGNERHILTVSLGVFADRSSASTVVTPINAARTLLNGAVVTITGYDRASIVCKERGVASFTVDGWTISDRYEIQGFATS